MKTRTRPPVGPTPKGSYFPYLIWGNYLLGPTEWVVMAGFVNEDDALHMIASVCGPIDIRFQSPAGTSIPQEY